MRLHLRASDGGAHPIPASGCHARFRARIPVYHRSRPEPVGPAPRHTQDPSSDRYGSHRRQPNRDLSFRNAGGLESHRADSLADVRPWPRIALLAAAGRLTALCVDHARGIPWDPRNHVMSIEVLKPGALTTLQDLGRYGYQRFG